MMDQVRKVVIIGAGYISREHMEVLAGLPYVEVTGIYDVNRDSANKLAGFYRIGRVYESLEEIIREGACTDAHVLVPPPYHEAVALPLLEAGINVFLEKPMAVSVEECRRLAGTAAEKGVRFKINHNLKYDPSFIKCKELLQEGSLGPVHHVSSYWNVPLRQLETGQFSHWMFQEPGNIVLEQGVHPLSQVVDLMGDVKSLTSIPSGIRELSRGKFFADTWNVSLDCMKGPAQLLFSVGQDFFSSGLLVLCADGQIYVDSRNNLCIVQQNSRWPDFYNSFLTGARSAWQVVRQSSRNLTSFVLSTVKLKGRSDAYHLSMKNSIESFYAGDGAAGEDARFGVRLVELCDEITRDFKADKGSIDNGKVCVGEVHGPFDVLVTGGTGFIGRKVVERLLSEKKRVKVLSRNVKMLPEIFYHPDVALVSGDIADRAKIAEAVTDIPIVIHLAHGGGGDDWGEIQKTMVEGTRNVADACLSCGVKRLVYVGSIAALYLGRKDDVVYGSTAIDRYPAKRGLYSRGKIACEALLHDMRRLGGLSYCIMRPGVVAGEGGMPFHSGIGFQNQVGHVIGWNDGNNHLPFVLVEDCAAAICLAAFSEHVDGKAYNIVGDVRLTAREYVVALGNSMERKFYYYPQSVVLMQMTELAKWCVKFFVQRRIVPFPSIRDLRSRGMVARFDCSDLKADLAWQPVADRDAFVAQGIKVYKNGN
ncbi:MAG: NAD-dependent epimerase/dehydratase family protein [Sedimentisphaerales bacterium]|nr:NAD-dependent epimerase/dehydratase family protein [Sedimentisphaerales bacterium]